MASESKSEEMSEEDGFAHAFFYFIKALKILAADADEQCEYMSNYNVAWQLKDDVSAGIYLLNLPAGELTQEEKGGIDAMVTALKKIPASLLIAAATRAANKKVMNDPWWVPIRARASNLLNLLAAATTRSEPSWARKSRRRALRKRATYFQEVVESAGGRFVTAIIDESICTPSARRVQIWAN